MTQLAFVAGATGYTGREVVAALTRRGVQTIAHVRPGSADLTRWRERFRTLGATVDETPWELAALRATLAGRRPTLVFALLGTTRARAAREGLTDAYERIDYVTGPDREETRVLERVLGATVDGVLSLAGVAGASALRDRWSSLTGAELADGMVQIALSTREARLVVDPADIRRALRDR